MQPSRCSTSRGTDDDCPVLNGTTTSRSALTFTVGFLCSLIDIYLVSSEALNFTVSLTRGSLCNS